MEGLDKELVKFFKDKKIIQNNFIYSNQTFYIFYKEEKEEDKKKFLSSLLCLIIKLNPLKLEPIDCKIKLDSLSDDTFLLNPFNENELCILTEKEYYIFDLQGISNQNIKFSSSIKNCKKIKFSWFPNHIGILFDNSFNYINIETKTEVFNKIIVKNNFVDFEFCPLMLKGFEIFMIFFLCENGEIIIFGPVFPKEFKMQKTDVFSIENNLLLKLKTDNSLSLSYKIFSELRNCLNLEKSDEDNFYFIINSILDAFNSNNNYRNLLIQQNFIDEKGQNLDRKYKQIYILKNKPLTVLRFRNDNKIEIITIVDDIFYSNTKMNFTTIENKSINNFIIERIDLELGRSNLSFRIIPFEENKIFLKYNNELFILSIPYLDTINQLYNTNSYNNIKITNFQSIIKKIIKGVNNEKNKFCLIFTKNECCIVIFEEKNIRTKIFEIDNEDEKNKNNIEYILSKYNYDEREIEKINYSLDVNTFINTTLMKEMTLELDDKDIKEDDESFENNLLEQIYILWMYYINILGKNYDAFINKCEIINKIYKQIDISNIKEKYEYLNKLINKIQNCKKEFEDNFILINKKIESIKEKLGIIQGNNKLSLCYLETIENFEKKNLENFHNIDLSINNSINKIKEIVNYSSSNLFPEEKEFSTDFLTKETKISYEKFKKFIEDMKNNFNKQITSK